MNPREENYKMENSQPLISFLPFTKTLLSMGTSRKEKGMLKLVHPGRHIEYHKRPITAAEIMRKNPRHSITRPDFFSNPDIVVSPESIMVPGQVFYIVPNKTVHKLVKNRSQPSSQQTESPKTNEPKSASKQTSPCKLWAGRTPMYHSHQEQEGSSSCPLPQPEETAEESLVDETSDESLTLSCQAKDYYLNRNGSAWSMPPNHGQQQRCDKQAKSLKSCIKKSGIRVSRNLRVTFDFTTMIEY